jgi:hypothetical protein
MIVLIIVLLTLFAGISYLGHRSYGPGIDAVPLIMLILLLFWLFGGGFHSLRSRQLEIKLKRAFSARRS